MENDPHSEDGTQRLLLALSRILVLLRLLRSGGMDSGSGFTTLAEGRVEGVRAQLRGTQSALTKAFMGQARVVTSLVHEGDI